MWNVEFNTFDEFLYIQAHDFWGIWAQFPGLFVGVAHNVPFIVKIGSKKQFLRHFTNFFSELLDCNSSY